MGLGGRTIFAVVDVGDDMVVFNTFFEKKKIRKRKCGAVPLRQKNN
jgi:hypothetical protein